MLYCNIFPSTLYDFDELVGLGTAAVKQIRRQRAAVLNTYPTNELLQVYVIARFMREILEAIPAIDPSGTRSCCQSVLHLTMYILLAYEDAIEILLATGPGAICCHWDRRSFDCADEELYWLGTESYDMITLYIGYFDVPFANIWKARKVNPPKNDEPATKYILDTIVGADDTCRSSLLQRYPADLLVLRRLSVPHPRQAQTLN